MTCVLYYSFDGIIPRISYLQIINIHSIKLDLTKAIVWNLFSLTRISAKRSLIKPINTDWLEISCINDNTINMDTLIACVILM